MAEIKSPEYPMPVSAITLCPPEVSRCLCIIGYLFTEKDHFFMHPVGFLIFHQKIVPDAAPDKGPPFIPAAVLFQCSYYLFQGVSLFRGKRPRCHLLIGCLRQENTPQGG